ncbi:cupin domain-containing protein [Collimonas sp.]|jgi:predicted cupin superfamily sugar epimerase|uniref:cupin domain-containing protein n=1 Tax=Collimonas sp. TaxID=1963772 RepID=UPI002B9886CD|nr:cupin domain-containing protein [Collimonas sp.]HWX03761.1 cupin domain-containing protein [Collimonas sp.]
MDTPARLIRHLSAYLEELEQLIAAGGLNAAAGAASLPAEALNIKNYLQTLNALPERHRLTADHIRHGLGLEAHPEGGFYREFVRNQAYTVIFYLLPEQAISSWHSLQDTKEKFRLISGGSLVIPKISADGIWKSAEAVTDDNDVVIEKNAAGFGDWFGAYPNGEYGLVTCECRGPFEFARFKIAGQEDLSAFRRLNPEHAQLIDRLAPKNG